MAAFYAKARPNVNPNRPFWPDLAEKAADAPAAEPTPKLMRELDHGLPAGDLLPRLVSDHDVDQDPARPRRHLFGNNYPGGLDGVPGPDRLQPSCLEPAVDGAGRIGPIGDHPRNKSEIIHAVHDDAAEIGLAE